MISATNNINFKKRAWLFLTMLLWVWPVLGSAQRNMNYAVYANIIYHFTKYIDWPEYRKNGDFIIGVVGDSPIVEELKKTVANKTAHNQRIVIKEYEPNQSTYDCHILFIGEENSSNLKRITGKTKEEPVLIVCEEEGLATRGACINFRISAQKLKIEINKENIEQRHMNIANELLRLSVVVD